VSLPEFSVRQIVLVNLLFVIVLVSGFFAATRIPIDVYPDISFNTALVNTVWSGASADEVERLVTTKLEDEIRDVDGIKDLTSFSQAGFSAIERRRGPGERPAGGRGGALHPRALGVRGQQRRHDRREGRRRRGRVHPARGRAGDRTGGRAAAGRAKSEPAR
jgi:hypothetical protein